MIALDKIQKTREYLNYLERHILNVEKAWKEVQKKCLDMKFVWDDFSFFWLDDEVKNHDISKITKEEFIAYRESFYPTDLEDKQQKENELHKNNVKKSFDKAWKHHYRNNMHHWEGWTNHAFYHPYAPTIHCAHMVIDWLAMSYEFGDTPREYYEKNKEKIRLPEWAVEFIYEIFERLEK